MRRVGRRKMVNRSEGQRYSMQALDKAWMIVSTVGLAKHLHYTALESGHICLPYHLLGHLSSPKNRKAWVFNRRILPGIFGSAENPPVHHHIWIRFMDALRELG
jgi:hypothetical protein